MQHPQPALAATRTDELASVGPKSVGHLLADSESEPGHDRLSSGQGVDIRVRGHEPERVERAVEDPDALIELGLASLLEPASGFLAAAEGLADLDDCGPSGADRRRSGAPSVANTITCAGGASGSDSGRSR
jgi:hypothetical protein